MARTVPLAKMQAFNERLHGRLVCPGDNDYDSARRVWNGRIDRRPAFIAFCANDADVVAAVRFAREHELLTAVRGGGHNVAGTAVCDDGLVIDLSLMKAIEVMRRNAGRERKVACDGGSSTGRRKPTAWRFPVVPIRKSVLPDLHWVVETAG